MNQHQRSVPITTNRKPFLNNSFAINQKLNKSRSLLKNSMLRCALKENNTELARSLSSKEIELLEIRKENQRLKRENLDLIGNDKGRSIYFTSYMAKFTELSNVALSLFTNVCKLSDELVEMKNHPFLAGVFSGGISEEIDTTANDDPIPSPFLSKDKIARSPVKSLHGSSFHESSTIKYLASRVATIKNQSNHSIHNLSTTMDFNSSFAQKQLNRADNSHVKNIVASTDDTMNLNIPIKSKESNVIARKVVSKKSKNEKDIPEKIVSTLKKSSAVGDPMYSPTHRPKAKEKKQKLKLKPVLKEANKEEYIKNKEKDAYYMSVNETLYTSMVGPSVNEFKNQQKETVPSVSTEEPKKSSIENEVVKPAEIIMSKETKQAEIPKELKKRPLIVSMDRHNLVNYNDDDDDFDLKPKSKKMKKRTHVLSDDVEENVLAEINIEDPVDTENDNSTKKSVTKRGPKPKKETRTKRKGKETEIPNDENAQPIVDKKRKKIIIDDTEEKPKSRKPTSNVSIIIHDVVNDGITDSTTATGRKKRQKNF